MRYQREKAVNYALKWALSRNPYYYNYDYLGGDCTNFISQCLFAGIPQMNYRGYGWYYIDANNKSPSWTGVRYLYDFLISNRYEGPQGVEIQKSELEIGDIIQLSFSNNIYGHSLIVTSIENEAIRVCAHTVDSKNRPLSTYHYEKARFIKII
ncbi:MAG: amidase domain-containing protein [Clostridia bacterium]|nr:amidase domain-containing protein [Clostridia bacterium]